jgi:hypothetical protein
VGATCLVNSSRMLLISIKNYLENFMTKDKIVYIAELDQDVDDVIAVEYLHSLGLLDYLVLDPYPVEDIGKQRLSMIKKMGIVVKRHLDRACVNVFCGGELTEIASHIKTGGTIQNLVVQGGFVGSNIVPSDKQLRKFRNKETARTFNFNCDVTAADYVLKTTEQQIGNIYCIGKNVCHNEINSDRVLWNARQYKELFQKYHVRNGKLQHDMLACHEGICLLKLGENVNVIDPHCCYLPVRPFNNGLNGNQTLWGSKNVQENTGYRVVTSAITFAESFE